MPDDVAPSMLTVDLLEECADRMRSLGAPFDESVSPGLAPAEMESLVAPIGIVLPDEAYVWWGWHNGFLAPGFVAAPLAIAVSEYEMMRQVAENTAEPGLETRETADELWWPTWLPIEHEKSRRVLNCAVGPGEPVPVHVATWELLAEDCWTPIARSLGEAMTWARDAMDSGALVWGERWWERGPRFGMDVPGRDFFD